MSSSSVEIANSHVDDRNHFLQRSASYNHLPKLSVSEPRRPEFRRTFSDLSPTQTEFPLKEDVAAGKDILRRTSQRSKEKHAIAVSRFTVSADELNGTANSESQDTVVKVPETRPPEPVARPSKAQSMSGRLASLARKPWISNADSRSPSPSAKSAKHRSLPSDDESPTRSQSSSPRSAPESDGMVPSRRRTVLYKRPRRPVIAVVAKSQEDNPSSPSSPSTQSPRSKGSMENLSSLHVSTPVLPARPKAAASATPSVSSGLEQPQRKDELWAAFRGLEADYQK
ncbi:hypothetical protein PHISCL_04133 [Aspergillus sclerotialis]|uniref:Uncharacterized protein n=1 Tax=Aspergillus sclerotialis TaxID=2070753 RepID=A0A3A2ZJX4_9EURO|nr:hypothetical protein PHISCL_04133 [Aspergillus sclerotialis]